ncbi:MAG: hypothetical protein LBH86_03170 [Oscillospiraceae bacterium]|jgi:hypothetical protein|nr:hypothetical protein [Oscillospiraceae bacterium]
MSELFEMAVALLASIGVVSVVWLCLAPLLDEGAPACSARIVLRLTDGADPMPVVGRFLRLCRRGVAGVRIVVLDEGLTPDVRRVVELLCRDNPALTLSAPAKETAPAAGPSHPLQKRG